MLRRWVFNTRKLVFKFGVMAAAIAPWLPKIIDRIGHLLDLGCTGIH